MNSGHSSPDSESAIARIIIGLDYGTTGTGVHVMLLMSKSGASTSSTNTPIRTQLNWLSANSDEPKWKVPSRIAYPFENRSFSMTTTQWGFKMDPSMVSRFWTKLFLDSDDSTNEFDDEFLAKTIRLANFLPMTRKDAKEVITDYLKHVLDFTRQQIEKRLSQSLDDIPVDIGFTVPATWSPEAKSSSIDAVIGAWSFRKTQDTLTIISEPDAAAKAVFSYESLKAEFQAGDGILICDCGGGTVDITTYLVRVSDPLDLLKISSMRGAKCGGAAIDSRLLALMEKNLPGAFNHLNHLIAPGGIFMEGVENMKKKFGTSKEHKFRLPLGLRRGRRTCNAQYFDASNDILTLEWGNVQSLFDPVVFKIMCLVNSQITEANAKHGSSVINKIILVGGFGSSKYLQMIFRQFFEGSGKLSVITPKESEQISAVSNGSALHRLHEIDPPKFQSPRHYGLAYFQNINRRFDSRADEERINWLILKGHEYQDGHPLTWYFSKRHQGNDARMIFVSVYSCITMLPTRIESPDTSLVGFIPVDLSSLNLNSSCLLNFRVECRFNVALGQRSLQFIVLILAPQESGCESGLTKIGEWSFCV